MVGAIAAITYVAIAGFFAVAGELLAPFLRQIAPSPAAAGVREGRGAGEGEGVVAVAREVRARHCR